MCYPVYCFLLENHTFFSGVLKSFLGTGLAIFFANQALVKSATENKRYETRNILSLLLDSQTDMLLQVRANLEICLKELYIYKKQLGNNTRVFLPPDSPPTPTPDGNAALLLTSIARNIVIPISFLKEDELYKQTLVAISALKGEELIQVTQYFFQLRNVIQSSLYFHERILRNGVRSAKIEDFICEVSDMFIQLLFTIALGLKVKSKSRPLTPEEKAIFLEIIDQENLKTFTENLNKAGIEFRNHLFFKDQIQNLQVEYLANSL